jgi:hypothetical protein
VHTARRREGDARTTRRVRVPYTVRGDLPSDARVTYVVRDESTGETSAPAALVIPAHATAGSIGLPYSPNRVDDLAVRTLEIRAYATRGVMTGSYIGAGRILDDDPSPRLTLTSRRRSVAEGTPARWRVTLAKPVNYYLDVLARPVRGVGHHARLTVGDLPKKVRRDHLFPVPPLDTPLWKTDFIWYVPVAPGRTTMRLRVPTLARPGRQGRRALTLRLHTPGQLLPGVHRTATVVVRDAS